MVSVGKLRRFVPAMTALAFLWGCGDDSTAEGGIVVVLDAATGAKRWEVSLPEVGLGVPSVDGGRVEVLAVHMPSRCEFDLTAVDLDAATGAVRNRAAVRPVPTFFYSSDPNVRTVVVGDIRYTSMPVAERESTVQIAAMVAGSAGPTWERTMAGVGPAGLAVTENLVVATWPSLITDQSDVLVDVVALDALSGATRWSTRLTVGGGWADRRLGQHQDMFAPVIDAFPPALGLVAPIVPSHGLATVAVVGDRVFVPRSGDELTVLDLADGREVGVIGDAGSPVAAAGGRLVARRDDALVALGGDGETVWTAALPEWAPLVRLAGDTTSVYVAVSGRYGGGPCPLD